MYGMVEIPVFYLIPVFYFIDQEAKNNFHFLFSYLVHI